MSATQARGVSAPIAVEAWRPSGIEDLEPAAWAALRDTGSVAVVAGPGAGKSEFLAQRATYLLQTATCPSPDVSWPSPSNETPQPTWPGE